jgi:hypothetical protein
MSTWNPFVATTTWRGHKLLPHKLGEYEYIYIYMCTFFFFFLLWRCDATWVMASSFLRFLDHTQRRPTVGRAPLEEWSARRRDLYLTTHNTHNRQISIPPVRFEPTISAGERPQTYALDRAATGTGDYEYRLINNRSRTADKGWSCRFQANRNDDPSQWKQTTY